MKINQTLSNYWLPILSGILIGTSYIPFPPWAIYFCFIPIWLFWLRNPSFKKIFLSGWITQYVFTLIGFNWVAHTVHEFGHLPIPIAFATLLIFCGFANLYVPIAGLTWFALTRLFRLSKRLSLVLLPVCMALSERIYPMIFDWNFGYSLIPLQFPIIHWAEIIGFEGLSALAILLNGPLLYCWQVKNTKQGKLGALSVVVFLILMNISGSFILKQLKQPDQKAQVLVVQANIGNLEKQAAEKGRGFRHHISNTYFRITRDALKEAKSPVDFIVWPETAFPDRVHPKHLSFGLGRKLQKFIQEIQTPLVTGIYSIKKTSGQVTNSLMTFNEKGELTDSPYHKTILLAFGEFIPGAQWFPKIKEWLPQVADFGRGNGPTAKKLNHFLIGPQICYEGLYPWFAKELADQNVHFIVNLTNDSWFGKWQEPFQHMYMTLARAIEFRRPVIRTTNTGVSTVALASGKILKQSPLHVEWSHTYEVPYSGQPINTFYQKFGIYLVPIFLYLLIGIILLKGWREKPRST